jgi:hypothetical protein
MRKVMLKPVRALSQSQTGVKQSNRRRTLSPISASVGKWWQQLFCQRCGAGLRLPSAQTAIPTNLGPQAPCSTQVEPSVHVFDAQTVCHTCPDVAVFF